MRFFSITVLVVLALLPAAPAEARLRIAWPSATTVAPGDEVAVGIRSTRVVRVSLSRLEGARPSTVVKARRMRRGRFVATVPSEGKFLLAVRVGARRFSRVIEAVAPLPPPPPPPPRCDESGRLEVSLSLDKTSARAGDPLTIFMHNTGTKPAWHGAEYEIERWNGSAWERAHEPKPFPSWAATVWCGERRELQGTVFEELKPGRHRVVKSFGDGVRPTAEFDVVA